MGGALSSFSPTKLLDPLGLFTKPEKMKDPPPPVSASELQAAADQRPQAQREVDARRRRGGTAGLITTSRRGLLDEAIQNAILPSGKTKLGE